LEPTRTSPEDWVPALDESALAEGAIAVVYPQGLSILLIRTGGRVFALRNRCAHMACTLARGKLEGYSLRCPCHTWRFDIRTGEFLDAREISIPTYECRSVGHVIHIRLTSS
jgi:nitrite reductase/ring-hydroxylating ferredoxin subunit